MQRCRDDNECVAYYTRDERHERRVREREMKNEGSTSVTKLCNEGACDL